MQRPRGVSYPKLSSIGPQTAEILKFEVKKTKSHRQTDRPTDRWTDRPTDRQTDRRTNLVIELPVAAKKPDKHFPWQ